MTKNCCIMTKYKALHWSYEQEPYDTLYWLMLIWSEIDTYSSPRKCVSLCRCVYVCVGVCLCLCVCVCEFLYVCVWGWVCLYVEGCMLLLVLLLLSGYCCYMKNETDINAWPGVTVKTTLTSCIEERTHKHTHINTVISTHTLTNTLDWTLRKAYIIWWNIYPNHFLSSGSAQAILSKVKNFHLSSSSYDKRP